MLLLWSVCKSTKHVNYAQFLLTRALTSTLTGRVGWKVHFPFWQFFLFSAKWVQSSGHRDQMTHIFTGTWNSIQVDIFGYIGFWLICRFCILHYGEYKKGVRHNRSFYLTPFQVRVRTRDHKVQILRSGFEPWLGTMWWHEYKYLGLQTILPESWWGPIPE